MTKSNRESKVSRGRVLMALSVAVSLALTAVLVYPYSGNQRTEIAQIGQSIAHSSLAGFIWTGSDSH
jgi:hypothetical protein